jgi:HEAT repeat protein
MLSWRWLTTTGVLVLTGCVISTDYHEPTPTKVIPLLLNLLHDPDPGQRQTAAQSLGKIADKTVAPALLEASRDPQAGVRRQAAWALGMIGDDSEMVRLRLIGLLFDGDAGVRESAAWALGRTGDAATGLSVLQHELSRIDSTSDTKRLAAAALGTMEIPSSVPLLRTLVQDPNPLVRRWAAAALAEINGREAIPTLSHLVRHDPDPHVRLEAAFRLGKMDDAAAVSALTAALKDSNEDVRRIAETALKGIGTSS